jgi:hypothetical protein
VRTCFWIAATVGWYWQGKTEELWEKRVPVPLCPPQIQGLTSGLRGGRPVTNFPSQRANKIFGFALSNHAKNKTKCVLGTRFFPSSEFTSSIPPFSWNLKRNRRSVQVLTNYKPIHGAEPGVAEAVRKRSALHGTRRLNCVFTTDRKWPLPWDRWNKSITQLIFWGRAVTIWTICFDSH